MTIDTASATADVRGPGPRAWFHLVVVECKMVIRDTAGLVVPLGLPLLIMVMFGQGVTEEPIPDFGGRTAFDAYVVPLVLVMVVATIGVINMPSFLASYRKLGVLKRLSATPVHPLMVLVAQVVTSLLQTAVGVGLAVTVGAAFFDLRAPEHLGVAVGVFALATAAMYAVGMVIAAVSPTINASVAIGLIAFFAMGAVGGMFGPTENLPEIVARIGEFTPFGAAVPALQAAWIGQEVGSLHVASLAIATAAAGLFSALFFRWDR
jgi:ABC-2 type transport system permease protein